jgi:hypothetical protein
VRSLRSSSNLFRRHQAFRGGLRHWECKCVDQPLQPFRMGLVAARLNGVLFRRCYRTLCPRLHTINELNTQDRELLQAFIDAVVTKPASKTSPTTPTNNHYAHTPYAYVAVARKKHHISRVPFQNPANKNWASAKPLSKLENQQRSDPKCQSQRFVSRHLGMP